MININCSRQSVLEKGNTKIPNPPDNFLEISLKFATIITSFQNSLVHEFMAVAASKRIDAASSTVR